MHLRNDTIFGFIFSHFHLAMAATQLFYRQRGRQKNEKQKILEKDYLRFECVRMFSSRFLLPLSFFERIHRPQKHSAPNSTKKHSNHLLCLIGTLTRVLGTRDMSTEIQEEGEHTIDTRMHWIRSGICRTNLTAKHRRSNSHRRTLHLMINYSAWLVELTSTRIHTSLSIFNENR